MVDYQRAVYGVPIYPVSAAHWVHGWRLKQPAKPTTNCPIRVGHERSASRMGTGMDLAEVASFLASLAWVEPPPNDEKGHVPKTLNDRSTNSAESCMGAPE